LIALTYGGSFNRFRPRTVPYGHEEYGLGAEETVSVLWTLSDKVQRGSRRCLDYELSYALRPGRKNDPIFQNYREEVCKKVKEFIGKSMMMDWRGRPTAAQLLEDDWFREDREVEGAQDVWATVARGTDQL